VPGESQGDSDRVNLQGRRDDVVEFTRAVGDDSSSTTAHIAKRITDFTTEGCRPNAFADQDLVESCQSRSSPDSPEGAGSTHQQVRSSGDTPIFTGRSFSKFSVVFCHSVELIERLYLTMSNFHCHSLFRRVKSSIKFL
jgi:hypothetical protein